MLLSLCAQLKILSTLLHEKYEVRNKILARGYADSSLLQAELEIIRVQKLITRHRRRCSQCRLKQSFGVGTHDRLGSVAFSPIQTH